MTEDTFEEADEDPPAVRFQWPTVTMHVLGFLGNVSQAAGLLFHGLARECACHVNYKMTRDQFASEAGREIEMLLEGKDG